MQVARLAGMPAPLIRQARATLEALESQQRAQAAQVDLFAASPPTPAEAPSPSKLVEAMDALDPDSLSPREALEALYRLKRLAQDSKDTT